MAQNNGMLTKEKFKDELRHALQEVIACKEGKIRLQSAYELLEEL